MREHLSQFVHTWSQYQITLLMQNVQVSTTVLAGVACKPCGQPGVEQGQGPCRRQRFLDLLKTVLMHGCPLG